MNAKSIKEAALMSDVTYIGGGTDIMPLLKIHVRDDENLVFLNGIKELKNIRKENDRVVIGSGVTLTELERDEVIKKELPALSMAAGRTASPQIRNIATIGGNIMQDRRCIYFNQTRFWRNGLPYCFKTGGRECLQIPNSPVCRAIYYSDPATALIAYDADVIYYESGSDTEKTERLEDFIKRHSEANGVHCREHLKVLIKEFSIPVCPEGERSGFYKYALRFTIDFPLINFALRLGGTREPKLVAGAVAVTPVVLNKTAALLNDNNVSDAEIIASCKEELKALSMPIREACIPPAVKRDLSALVKELLYLR